MSHLKVPKKEGKIHFLCKVEWKFLKEALFLKSKSKIKKTLQSPICIPANEMLQSTLY